MGVDVDGSIFRPVARPLPHVLRTDLEDAPEQQGPPADSLGAVSRSSKSSPSLRFSGSAQGKPRGEAETQPRRGKCYHCRKRFHRGPAGRKLFCGWKYFSGNRAAAADFWANSGSRALDGPRGTCRIRYPGGKSADHEQSEPIRSSFDPLKVSCLTEINRSLVSSL